MGKEALSPSASTELLYGRPGYLYALLLVSQALSPSSLSLPSSCVPSLKSNRIYQTELDKIQKMIDNIFELILADGKEGAKRSFMYRAEGRSGGLGGRTNDHGWPLLWSWHSEVYLGAAHGVAGSLTMLMSVPRLISSRVGEESGETKELILSTIDTVLDKKLPNGNYPVRADEIINNSRQLFDDKELVQFCHGAPGMICMFLKAYEVFNDERYLTAAKHASEVVWEHGVLRKGVGKCQILDNNIVLLLFILLTFSQSFCRSMSWHFWKRNGFFVVVQSYKRSNLL
jgi:hypothetical protein